MAKPATTGDCLHCHRRSVPIVPIRGLCRTCYHKKDVRQQYRKGRPQSGFEDGEPTEAELDALIEERRKPENLPDWWDAEDRKMQEAKARGWKPEEDD